MKLKLLFTGSIIVAVLVILVAARNRSLDETDYATKKAMLVVRDIGHKVLIQAGDFSSRILPVKEISKQTFQLEFQSSFSFMPDSLVSIVRKNIAASDISDNYMVNVLQCSSKQIVYGFEIAPMQNNIVPCRGRAQPLSCYTIQITFADFGDTRLLPRGYDYLVALIGFCVVALMGNNYLQKTKKTVAVEDTDCIQIGSYYFHQNKQVLKSQSGTVVLSGKESKILGILATHQNELIIRDRLLKEVWEDDGVFTGRSLDMFISKLRKRFKEDPTVNIVNVHGKGYKLEVSMSA